MTQQVTLEVCIDSVESAINAQEGGGDRLELCRALDVGGLTPTLELIQQVVLETDLPVMTMVRPRGGSFVYSETEIAQMCDEIQAAKSLGVTGVVFGCLDASGGVAIDVCQRLVEHAGSLSVTFHRAFDEVTDPFVALKQIQEIGCSRILTSGQAPTAMAGVTILKHLIEMAGKTPIIMPGAGVRPENAAEIVAKTRAREIHGTASEWLDPKRQTRKVTSKDTVRAIRQAIDAVKTIDEI